MCRRRRPCRPCSTTRPRACASCRSTVSTRCSGAMCQAPIDVFADLRRRSGSAPAPNARARQQRRRSRTGGPRSRSRRSTARWRPARRRGAEIAEAVAAELAAEARHCFAFAPTVALMRAAKAKRPRRSSSSATPILAEAQLRALIAAAAGAEVAALIDRIFCSSEYRRDQGRRPVRAGARRARRAAAARSSMSATTRRPIMRRAAALGIHAVHFRQFDAAAEQRLRLEAAAAAILDPDDAQRPARSCSRTAPPSRCAPRRSGLAARPRRARAADARLRPLAEGGGRPGRSAAPKLVFLLRDGHLPQRVYRGGDRQARPPPPRSAASPPAAPSFTGARGDLRLSFGGQARHGRINVLASQLGLAPGGGPRSSAATARRASSARSSQPQNVRKIVDRSARFRRQIVRPSRRPGRRARRHGDARRSRL